MDINFKKLCALIILLGFFHLCKSQDTNPCLKSLCRAPSICENLTNGSFVCHCKPGTRGKYCERLLIQDEDLCGSSPCWSGGTCVGNTTHWSCICPPDKNGIDCRDYANFDELVVKILNKGWYIAKLTLFYKRSLSNGEIYRQTGSIAIGQDYAFYLPYDVDLSSTVFVAHAIAGIRIFSERIETKNDCFHVWGTTLIPYWSRMPCW